MAREKTGKSGGRARGLSDPIGDRIRELRTARRLSLQELAARVDAAPSHIFHIENGDKVPNEDLAARIARELGEDEDVFRAWARARGRTDFYTAAESADVVRKYLGSRPRLGEAVYAAIRKAQEEAPRDPAAEAPESAGEFVRPEMPRELPSMLMSLRGVTEIRTPRPTRLLIPVVAEGEDPGDEPRPPRPVDVVRLDPRALPKIEELERPFAYPLSAANTRRVAGILPERGHAVITRRRAAPVLHEVYAIRHGGAVVLSRAMWNGRQLLLLPAPGASDFDVLEATSPSELERHIVGMVALVRAAE